MSKAKITALDIETLAALLAKSGGKVTADMIKADVAAGAPVNPDGTINLVSYAAWLVKQAGDRRLEAGGKHE